MNDSWISPRFSVVLVVQLGPVEGFGDLILKITQGQGRAHITGKFRLQEVYSSVCPQASWKLFKSTLPFCFDTLDAPSIHQLICQNAGRFFEMCQTCSASSSAK